jgi:hypothetical protein
LDGTNSKTLQASFNNFRASVLAQDKEDKSKKGPATEGRKTNKNANVGKISDKKETSSTNKLTTVNIPNVVDNLSAEIGFIKLEERSPDTNSSTHSGFDLFFEVLTFTESNLGFLASIQGFINYCVLTVIAKVIVWTFFSSHRSYYEK